jgi:hypothetical protein
MKLPCLLTNPNLKNKNSKKKKMRLELLFVFVGVGVCVCVCVCVCQPWRFNSRPSLCLCSMHSTTEFYCYPQRLIFPHETFFLTNFKLLCDSVGLPTNFHLYSVGSTICTNWHHFPSMFSVYFNS